MKRKVKILCYECKKCNRMVYLQSNEQYTTRCKICDNEMRFMYEHNYNPKGGLLAIKNSNISNKAIKKNNEENIPKCPTCNSTKIKKISSLSKIGSVAAFGIFSQKVKHQFKCGNCGYEW